MRKTIHLAWISILAIAILLSACSGLQTASTPASGAPASAGAPPATNQANTPAATATSAPATSVPSATAAMPATAATPATATSTAQAAIPNSGGAGEPASAAGGAGEPASAAGGAGEPASAAGGAGQTAAQPALNCTSPAALTPAVTEGPYFKAGSPEESNLVQPGMSGTKLTITGYVLDTNCQPVAHALLDFWQADAQGQYDNSGYTLRGHVYTDANGRYQVETVMPGLYPGRTEHIHVKVQPSNGNILTTQLFFPGVTQNQSDGIFDQRLLVDLKDGSGGKVATYTFIVQK